jgi:hypothetical protein
MGNELLLAYMEWENLCYVQQMQLVETSYKNFVRTLEYLRFRHWSKNFALSSSIPLISENEPILELLYKPHEPI